MEPQENKEHEDEQGSDSPHQGEPNTGNSAAAPGPPVIETDEPGWISQPERTMAIETSRIRAPSATLNPNILIVPVESDGPQRDRSRAKNGGGKANEYGQEEGRNSEAGQAGNGTNDQSSPKKNHKEDQDGSGNRRDVPRGQSGQAPSLTRTLLFSGLVALVCGVVGAAGYSYLFGSSKSTEEKSAGKGSDSDKGSDSSKGSKSGKGSDPGSNSGSSQDSGSSQSSDLSKKGSDAAKLLQAEAAWLAAVQELRQAQAAEKAVRSSENDAKAVLDFLKNTLLSAGHPGDVSLKEAFWAGGQGKDLTLRKAVDASESQVAEAFADRPLAEASVREILGLAYLSLGDAAQSVKQYERAYRCDKRCKVSTSPIQPPAATNWPSHTGSPAALLKPAACLTATPIQPPTPLRWLSAERCCLFRRNPPKPS